MYRSDLLPEILDLPTKFVIYFIHSFGSVHYIVLTSVDRDDLPDGGSGHFARTVKAMKVCYLIHCNS